MFGDAPIADLPFADSPPSAKETGTATLAFGGSAVAGFQGFVAVVFTVLALGGAGASGQAAVAFNASALGAIGGVASGSFAFAATAEGRAGSRGSAVMAFSAAAYMGAVGSSALGFAGTAFGAAGAIGQVNVSFSGAALGAKAAIGQAAMSFLQSVGTFTYIIYAATRQFATSPTDSVRPSQPFTAPMQTISSRSWPGLATRR